MNFTPQLIAINHESEVGFDNAARYKMKVLKHITDIAKQWIEIENEVEWKKHPMNYFISQLEKLRVENNLPHYWDDKQLTDYLNIDLTFFKINCKTYQNLRILFNAKGEIIKPSFEIFTTNEKQNRVLEDIKTICSILNDFNTKHNLDITINTNQLGKSISEFTTNYNGAVIPNSSRILQINEQ